MRMELVPPAKMDPLDLRILSVLQQNARVSISNLSRYLGRPKPTILYHLDQLEKEKIIREYRTHLTLFKPHVRYALIFLHFTEENIELVRMELAKNPYCFTLFSAGGSYNTIMGVAYPSALTRAQVIESVTQSFSLVRSEWCDVEDFSLFSLNYADTNVNVHEPTRGRGNTFQSFFEMAKKKESISLSPNDILLLRALSQNARCSLTELVDYTKMNKTKLKRRIGELIRSGAITKFSVSVNPYAFDGMTMAFVLVNAAVKDHDQLKRFIARRQSGNGFATFSQGGWSAGAMLHFRSKSELVSFENELRTACPSLKDYQINLVNQQYCLNWFPPAVEEALLAVHST